MFQINSENLNKINFLNILIALIPLSLIIGNLASNLNIIFIIVTGTIIFGKEIFFVKKKIYGLLIYSFFFFLIITTFFNNFNKLEVNSLHQINIYKSLIYLRFLMLFLIINKMIENENLNIKIFFVSSAFFSSIIAFDIIFQSIFKINLVGLSIDNFLPSSFFGQEHIAGSFIQRFILFFIFLIVLKNKNYNSDILTLLLFSIITIPIFLTGNRMPLFTFFIISICYFLFNKKIKEIFFVILIIVTTFFFLINQNNFKNYKLRLHSFYGESIMTLKHAPKLFYNTNYQNSEIGFASGYIIHFNSGIQLWKKNKIFGSGMKSFRINCTYGNNQTCNTHPHNYAIELALDMGLIGLILFYSIIISGTYNFFQNYYSKINYQSKLICFIFSILIFAELFPIKSTGSFFTTSNSIVIFLFLPFFLNIKKIIKLSKIYKI